MSSRLECGKLCCVLQVRCFCKFCDNCVSDITYGIAIDRVFAFNNYERIIRWQRRRDEDLTRVVFDSSRQCKAVLWILQLLVYMQSFCYTSIFLLNFEVLFNMSVLNEKQKLLNNSFLFKHICAVKV